MSARASGEERDRPQDKGQAAQGCSLQFQPAHRALGPTERLWRKQNVMLRGLLYPCMP